MPYPEYLVAPMREDLTRAGVEELRTAADVVVINTLLLLICNQTTTLLEAEAVLPANEEGHSAGAAGAKRNAPLREPPPVVTDKRQES